MSSRYLRLGVVAFTLSLAYGIWYGYSVVLVALLREYGWSRSVLAGAFSVFTLVHGGVAGAGFTRPRVAGALISGYVARMPFLRHVFLTCRRGRPKRWIVLVNVRGQCDVEGLKGMAFSVLMLNSSQTSLYL